MLSEVEWLFDEHYARLVASLSVAAGSRDAAQDAVQEAFVQAHLRWAKIGGYEDPVGWIRRVAVHRISNHHRSTGRALRAIGALSRERVADDPPLVDRVDLARALKELSAQQRIAVALYYLEGLTVEQTAADMGVSAGTIKTHLARARSALRSLLEVS